MPRSRTFREDTESLTLRATWFGSRTNNPAQDSTRYRRYRGLTGKHAPPITWNHTAALVFVVIRSLALAAFGLTVAAAQGIPVLTVCEGLHELWKHNDTKVIVVGPLLLHFRGDVHKRGV